MAAKRAEAENPTIEASLQRLEEIVTTLEEESTPLETAIALYEEGTKLAQNCKSYLEGAELRISALRQKENGTIEEVDFEEGVEY